VNPAPFAFKPPYSTLKLLIVAQMRCKRTERAKRKLSESTTACGLFQLQLGKKMVEKIHALIRRKKKQAARW
jgi:hypothetical protein